MATSVGRKAVRAVVVIVGVFVILALGLYGPATLVGPLPPANASVDETAGGAATSVSPTMPTTGASAIVADVATPVIASSGLTEAVPMGGSAKIITALVVLAAKPLAAGSQGPTIAVSKADADGYQKYVAESARTVAVAQGENWSQREMMEAMLLGSSNNHADTLARWAYGSIDAYLEAAQAWLTARGLTGITVVDATGLDENDIGTASDLARVSAFAFSEASISEIMASDADDIILPGNRRIDNLAAYLPDLGYTGVSRSYTDQAGICYLFALAVPVAGASGTAAGEATLYGAFIREPDWDTLDADLEALAGSAAGTITQTDVVTEGQAFVTYTTPWGETAHGVAMATESRMLWNASALQYRVDTKPLTTGAQGEQVGSVTVTTPDGDVNVLLELDRRLGDPGPLWRLTNPVPVISAFIESRTKG
jgi:D-alanyl-D-alanine carboxypeptidase (penicillin-binding protein 5/6)